MSTRTRTRQMAKMSSQDAPSVSTGKATVAKKTYCLCARPDDGSPMIHCSACKDWYHFTCVGLSERDAEDIELYVCPACQEKTGARTIKNWEGQDSMQEVVGENTDAASSSAPQGTVTRAQSEAELKAEEVPDSGLSSDGSDEYDPEADKIPNRRVRRPSYHSENESDSDGSRAKSPKRLRRGSAPPKEPTPKEPSPASSSQTKPKRKKPASAHPQPSKRPRSESTAGEDAARKYCLTKLQELFCQIFMRYPFLKQAAEEEEASDLPLQLSKITAELTAEDKQELELRAKQFGVHLEQCVYELYAEPDKQGKLVVAGKYKERFRMLTFNLSKADRVVLHMRIASSDISPKELSTMSSTDLASEEEKQSIKKLEEAALAHSILKKSTAPRAKITHKGLEDIEDVTGAARREAQREREEEEEERIERERLMRLRLQAQRAQSQGSAPPESPVVAQTPTWGAPPPVPLHAVQSGDIGTLTSVPMGRPPAHPLFVPSASESFVGAADIELNLADLINIDEESSGEVAMTPVDEMPTPFGENPPSLSVSISVERGPHPAPSPITPTHAAGISPFAAKGSQSDVASGSSFDLNALWTPTESDAHPSEPQAQPQPQESTESATTEDHPNEPELLQGSADDQDFDMFLNNNDPEQAEEQRPPLEPVAMTPEEKRVAFDAQPQIWKGTLSMPLDSAIPQEVAVVARQAGGRALGSDSLLWQSLFPMKELRIDGRVPVEKSAQYLTQVRLNPSKELIAGTFSPAPGSDPASFHALINYLLSKGRHGLIFPWGHNPKASAPGRELYVVPLPSSSPIPEFMELLDELRLPPQRTADYLIGIWVLTKGKLVAPPQPAPAPAPTIAPTAPPLTAPPSLPNIDFAQLAQLQQRMSTPPQPHFPLHPPLQTHSPVGGMASAIPAVPVLPTQSVAPAYNLAAEVASLTPEQIKIMLQALNKTSQGITQPPSSLPGVPMPPYPAPPIAPPTASLQGWTAQAQQYPPPYPQQQPPHYPSPHSGSHTPPGAWAPHNDGYNRDRPYSNHNHNNGGHEYDRGYRGRGGRGRGGGGERGRSRDHNWQKGSSRGRGGGLPTGSRNRGGDGGWGADQQRWN